MPSSPIFITSPDDPRIADYVSVRERDLTGREGKFIVEGKVTLEVFLTRSRFAVESVFLETGRLSVLADLLETLPDHVPVYAADQSVMDQIVGFPIHRGILACGRKEQATGLANWLNEQGLPDTLVVAIGLSNHDNAGAVFRNTAALGGQAVILDETGCDPLYRKSIRVSAGTALWLPFFHGDSAQNIFETLKSAGYALWTLTPDVTATALYDAPHPDRAAIILGPEGPGLPEDLIDQGVAIRIPMTGHVDSLNVATSLAIVLSHRLSSGLMHHN